MFPIKYLFYFFLNSLFVEFNAIDKRNISNIGVKLMLQMRDTSSEDGLSVVRTLFDRGIEFHKLSASKGLPQRTIIELTVKFLIDGENLEDRQHAVKLLKGKYVFVGFRSFTRAVS